MLTIILNWIFCLLTFKKKNSFCIYLYFISLLRDLNLCSNYLRFLWYRLQTFRSFFITLFLFCVHFLHFWVFFWASYFALLLDFNVCSMINADLVFFLQTLKSFLNMFWLFHLSKIKGMSKRIFVHNSLHDRFYGRILKEFWF